MCIKHLNSTYLRSRSTANQYQNRSSNQQQHQQVPSMNTGRSNYFRSGATSSGNTSARPPPAQPSAVNKEPISKEIQEVRDISEIDTFSTKQLKYLLIKNCIDYKGVIEKEELRSRARQLWIEFNEKKARRSNRKQQATNVQQDFNNDDSDEIEDSQMCKICMEQEINCVLLDCGHYLTCVTCARKLSECPVCRQNVVRCVRTFKA